MGIENVVFVCYLIMRITYSRLRESIKEGKDDSLTLLKFKLMSLRKGTRDYFLHRFLFILNTMRARVGPDVNKLKSAKNDK
jgi:hypothetical protein